MTRDTDGINLAAEPSGTGCLECAAEGSWWFHLRRCAECGHIGCCDDSLNMHASKHAQHTGHPVIQSFEPGEDWFYDYRTQETFDGPTLKAPHHHPVSQPTPGPEGRVPPMWQRVLMQAKR
ncbi:MAG: UBP-type zinc finger domain-containing protein [Luteibacter sp.]